MIIEIDGRTPAHLEQLEQFFHTKNWVSYPTTDIDDGWNPEQGAVRKVEHPFAWILKKARDKKQPDEELYCVTLEVSQYICDARSGTEIKVPARYLLELLQALDLFPERAEHINLGLLM